MSDLKQRIGSLSPRQLEILIHVTRHMSSRDIGRILGLSTSTVDSHVATALRKLGLASRREAALRLIETGLAPPMAEAVATRPSSDFRHRGSILSNFHELRRANPKLNSSASGDDQARSSGEQGDGSTALAINSAMARIIARFLLDGLYIVLFLAIMSAVASGAHWIVVECKRSNMDPFVLIVLKAVSYMLVVLDAVGVVTVTGLLTYRFIRATMKAIDRDARN